MNGQSYHLAIAKKYRKHATTINGAGLLKVNID